MFLCTVFTRLQELCYYIYINWLSVAKSSVSVVHTKEGPNDRGLFIENVGGFSQDLYVLQSCQYWADFHKARSDCSYLLT